MNYVAYQQLCEAIVSAQNPQPPYTNPVYMHYAKLNVSRMNRWWRDLELSETLSNYLKDLSSAQTWIIIAEPWCGDAAPAIPFLVKLAELNPLIQYDIQLRDSAPFLIEQYLTNGSKSIPKFIVRDTDGKDLFTWGPRPSSAQALVDELVRNKVDMEVKAVQLQNWYNKDKGEEMQRELMELFKEVL